MFFSLSLSPPFLSKLLVDDDSGDNGNLRAGYPREKLICQVKVL
jgi:hypothetical protein